MKFITTILLTLCFLIFIEKHVDAAGNDYMKALKDLLDVSPNVKSEEDTSETSPSPEVEFYSNDMKFLNLTLKNTLILALQNNYDIKIAKLAPIIEEKDIVTEESAFDPTLEITGTRNVSELPTTNQLTTGISGTSITKITEFRQDINDINTSISKPFETGATVSLDFNLRLRSFLEPSPFSPLNPQSTASIGITVTQPLLRNAGIFYNKSKIYIARNDKKKSLLQLRETAIGIVNNVQNAYWELVKAIEDLRVRNKSLERAEDLLRKNKIQVEVGTMAPIEVIEAEEGVASQLEGVIKAENDIKDREDDLRLVMNVGINTALSDVVIVPLDKAVFEINEISLEESIKSALENRPELFIQSIDVENSRITVKQKRNELLPQLDLEAGIRYSGLAGNSGNAIDSALSERFQSEFFGVTLEVPIGNRAAKSSYSRAKLEARQTLLDREKTEQVIIVEVRKAVRRIKTDTERIKATKKALELANKRLEAEDKKFKVGRSTSLEVIRAQEDLAVAEGKSTNAIVDYQKSLGNLDAVLGINLKENNIIIDDNGPEIRKR